VICCATDEVEMEAQIARRIREFDANAVTVCVEECGFGNIEANANTGRSDAGFKTFD